MLWGRAARRRQAIDAELHRLTSALRRLPGVVEVWVFGSAVTGTVHATSDLDLLVVRETDEQPVERGVSLARELEPRVPVDLFVYTPAEMAAGGRFVDDVRRHGRLLW